MKSSKFYNLIFTLACVVLCSNHAYTQSLLPVNYNQSNTAVLYNPAAWNTDILKYPFLPSHSLGLQARKQWVGIEAAPQNYFLGYDLMKPKNMIFGIGVLNDEYGPFNTFSFSTRIAYRKFVNEKSFFSIGFLGSYSSQKYNPANFSIAQANDLIVGNSDLFSNISVGTGLSFSNNISTTSNFTIGIALMNAAKVNLGKKAIGPNVPVISFHTQYFKFYSEDYKRLSYIEIKTFSKINYQFLLDQDVYFKYQHKGLIGFAPGFRIAYSDKFALTAFHFDLGLPIGNYFAKEKFSIDLNYSFEYPLNNIKSISTQSHEIGLAFLF